MKCNCDDKCCELYNDIDEDDNQYFIERLEDIIEICEFLIQVTKHKKMKKDTCDTILKDLKKESEKEKEVEEDKKEISNEDLQELYQDIYRHLLKYIVGRPYYQKYYTHEYPYDWKVWF